MGQCSKICLQISITKKDEIIPAIVVLLTSIWLELRNLCSILYENSHRISLSGVKKGPLAQSWQGAYVPWEHGDHSYKYGAHFLHEVWSKKSHNDERRRKRKNY